VVKRKIFYITGTRADYGLMRSTLKAIKDHPQLDLFLVVTGMHLAREFGYTLKEIKKDGFKIEAKIPVLNAADSKISMIHSFGKQVIELAEVFKSKKPDIVLVEGDRGEMLAAAIAGRYLGIVVAHVSGGDIASNSMLDDPIRDSITKFAQIHFPGTKKSRQRLIKMGEEPERIYLVGDPGTDSISDTEFIKSSVLAKRFNLDLHQPILIVLQHPVSDEADEAGKQMVETMTAIKDLGRQTIVLYPNADAGGRAMIRVIKKYERSPFIRIYPNLAHDEFISLMRIASVMIGNSSSGIIEAPFFKLPVVNIGTREAKRERTDNVIDVGYRRKQIVKAVKEALFDKRFKREVKRCKSPYLATNAGEKIAKLLAEIEINKELLKK